MLWFGVFIVACGEYTQSSHYVTIASPLFVAFLLIKVSGIPLLEKAADKRWGDTKEYQDYKRNTAVLVPFVW
jgi:steroid 5-alpha reductase family enzyme